MTTDNGWYRLHTRRDDANNAVLDGPYQQRSALGRFWASAQNDDHRWLIASALDTFARHGPQELAGEGLSIAVVNGAQAVKKKMRTWVDIDADAAELAPHPLHTLMDLALCLKQARELPLESAIIVARHRLPSPASAWVLARGGDFVLFVAVLKKLHEQTARAATLNGRRGGPQALLSSHTQRTR